MAKGRLTSRPAIRVYYTQAPPSLVAPGCEAWPVNLNKLRYREHIQFTDSTPQKVGPLADSDIHRVYLAFSQSQAGVVTTVATLPTVTLNDGLFLNSGVLYEFYRRRSGLLCSQQWYCQSTGGTVAITVYEAWDYGEPIEMNTGLSNGIQLGTDGAISRQLANGVPDRSTTIRQLIESTIRGLHHAGS